MRSADPTAGQSVDELLDRLAAEDADLERVVPEADRDRVRRGTLFEFWDEFLRPDREKQVARGEIAKGTLDKERQTLKQFEAWNVAEKPTYWPADLPWKGQVLGKLQGRRFERWIASQRERGCSESTIEPRWYHVRTVLNMAVSMKVLTACPSVEVAPPQRHERGVAPEVDDLCATSYTEEQLNGVFRDLGNRKHAVEHQVAWVLGANAGPRAEDLYGLHWHTNIRLEDPQPILLYRAQKTGKTHWIPLAPITVKHLRRLMAGRLFVEGPVFPSLSGHHCKDPGRSRASRQRTKDVKAALESTGLKIAGDYEKPIQVLRSTCNSRMKDHRPAVGHLLTHGPDYNEVNVASYDNWKPRIIEAVMTLPQPSAFQI